MATQEEIIVKARPEGLDETSEGFADMEESMEEAKGGMEETTDQFAELSERWSGTMKALVAGLAVASAGLLSQVPVIGEAMSGLGAIVDSIAFKMDQTLRPVLQPVADGFFGIANAIFEAEGPLGTIIGIVATVVSGLTLLAAAFVAIGAVIGPLVAGATAFIGALGTLAGIVTTVGSALLTLGSVIAGLISLPALLVAAFVALIAILATDFMGIRTMVIDAILGLGDAIADVAGDIGSAAGDIATEFANGIADFVGDVATAAGNIAGEVAGAIGGLVDDAIGWGEGVVTELISGFLNLMGNLGTTVGNVADEVIDELGALPGKALEWGKNIVNSLVEGIKNAPANVAGAASDVAGTVTDYIGVSSPTEMGPLKDLPQFGQNLTDTFASGIEANIGTIEGASERVASGARPSGGSSGRGNLNLSIDGRKLDESTGRYGRDGTARRGI